MSDDLGDRKILKNADDLKEMGEEIYEYLVDAVVLERCFNVHRIFKLIGAVLPHETSKEPTIVSDHDIFGSESTSQTKHQKSMEVVCDVCQRPIAASRFAPHLEKCMGMGRNSSRIAQLRINQTINYTNSERKRRASTSRSRRFSDQSDEDSHNTAADDDEDWASSRRSRKSRKTKLKSKMKTRTLLSVCFLYVACYQIPFEVLALIYE
ncbi:unnamed protein product [Thelazia callipaeda]|uniref:SAGA-associated factor 11 n=1 Tax=Thelazia callipaeda TaxID=103827 RepID=A0A0N5CRJ2_THECL|nr:unnamed protein product [Thelazia callipaeda]